ncbi:hypothetical protein GCM10022221_49610 [Actinocorallia aurea]
MSAPVRVLVCDDQALRVQLWDVETRTKQGEVLRSAAGQDDPGDQILKVVFSPDGRLLATGTKYGDGAVHLWRP